MKLIRLFKPISFRTDLSQSYSRLLISTLAFVYLLFASLQQNIYADLFFKPAVLPVFLFLSFAIALHIWIKLWPKPIIWRRGLTIVADTLITCYGMYLTGPFSGVLYPILLWIIIANGMRFGSQYLYFSMAISTAGLIITILNTPFLTNYMPVSVGMIMGVFILPLFFGILLHELKESHRELQAQIHKTTHAAAHDILTGLPNRLFFIDHVTAAIKTAREQHKKLALLFIDLDGFKKINDNMGHKTGDRLLQLVAKRIKARLRDGDTVARLGGDEFVVLLNNVNTAETAMIFAERLIDIFNEPFYIDHRTVLASGSVGISLFPGHGEDVDTLIHHADTAMYKVKRRGGNHIETFNSEIEQLRLLN
ncbi:MAG: diguanylate cyclase [Gammaproteobacteria bacterium]|nr:diguanylate cyclase [Gammaproteobacteria bacterium]